MSRDSRIARAFMLMCWVEIWLAILIDTFAMSGDWRQKPFAIFCAAEILWQYWMASDVLRRESLRETPQSE